MRWTRWKYSLVLVAFKQILPLTRMVTANALCTLSPSPFASIGLREPRVTHWRYLLLFAWLGNRRLSVSTAYRFYPCPASTARHSKNLNRDRS